MPRGRNSDDRLADLERRLDALDAQEPRLTRREQTDGEVVETALVLLAYVHHGDAGAFAEHLIQDHGVPFEEAEEIAGVLADILEERRASAADPQRPV